MKLTKIIAFHGTDSKPFKVFDLEKAGSTTDEGFLGRGIYLSTDPTIGRSKKHTLKVTVTLKKPLRLKSDSDFGTHKTELMKRKLKLPARTTGQRLTNIIKAKGHDGVILDYSPAGYNEKEVVAFDPSQIKVIGQIQPPTRGFGPRGPNRLVGGPKTNRSLLT